MSPEEHSNARCLDVTNHSTARITKKSTCVENIAYTFEFQEDVLVPCLVTVYTTGNLALGFLFDSFEDVVFGYLHLIVIVIVCFNFRGFFIYV